MRVEMKTGDGEMTVGDLKREPNVDAADDEY